MTLAIDSHRQQKLPNFEEFLARYGSDRRYELIDGEVCDLKPTGTHEGISAFITTKTCVEIDKSGLPWLVIQRCLFRPSDVGAGEEKIIFLTQDRAGWHGSEWVVLPPGIITKYLLLQEDPPDACSN